MGDSKDLLGPNNANTSFGLVFMVLVQHWKVGGQWRVVTTWAMLSMGEEVTVQCDMSLVHYKYKE